MIRRLPTADLFHVGPAGLEEISDETLKMRVDALYRAKPTDPAATLPSVPLSQIEPLEAV